MLFLSIFTAKFKQFWFLNSYARDHNKLHKYVHKLQTDLNVLIYSGFYIRFQNRLSCRATIINSRLTDRKFWLPNIVNIKIYNTSCSCSVGQSEVNIWLSDNKKWLPDTMCFDSKS